MVYNDRRVRMPTVQQPALPERGVPLLFLVLLLTIAASAFSIVRRRGLTRDIFLLFARIFACGASQNEPHEDDLGEDSEEFLYMVDSWRKRLNAGSLPDSNMRIFYCLPFRRTTKVS